MPGTDKMKAWLGSSSSEVFNLGVATFIFQLFTLEAAAEDVAGNDQFNRIKTDVKVAAAVVNIIDVMNTWESIQKREYGMTFLYASSASLGFYTAYFALSGVIPGFWFVLVASILIALAIAHYKASAIKEWIGRCYFSTGAEKYGTFEEELSAYGSAAGG